jgi:hypothetical protein
LSAACSTRVAYAGLSVPENTGNRFCCAGQITVSRSSSTCSTAVVLEWYRQQRHFDIDIDHRLLPAAREAAAITARVARHIYEARYTCSEKCMGGGARPSRVVSGTLYAARLSGIGNLACIACGKGLISASLATQCVPEVAGRRWTDETHMCRRF